MRKTATALGFLLIPGLALLLMYFCLFMGNKGSGIDNSGIRISEVCSSNYQAWRDENQGYTDYIELHNNTDCAVDLADYAISKTELTADEMDRADSLSGLTVPAGAYLILKACGVREAPDCLSFKLKGNKKGTLYLYKNGEPIDRMEYPALERDTAYGLVEGVQPVFAVLSPSPGQRNPAALKGRQEAVVPPTFSMDSGFYAHPGKLTLLGEGNAIYYTTDGSAPTPENGILYAEPIDLEELFDRPPHYAAREDVSTGFLFEELEKRGCEPSGYMAPDINDTGVVVRGICVDGNGNISREVSKSYFPTAIGTHYLNLPVLSLIVDPEDLFGDEKGIYVLGDGFTRDPESGMSHHDWWWWYANYFETGREWERVAHTDYFDSNKRLVSSETLGLRIAGGSSRGYAQKSLRLVARDALSGNKWIGYDYLGTGKHYKNLLLSSGGNDLNSHMKDYLAQEFLKDEPFSTSVMKPCAVFINGEYWGYYYFSEKYDEDYLEEYYGVDSKDAVVIRNKRLSIGKQEDTALYEELLEFESTTDFSIPENYEELCRRVDMESYIRYYAAQLYMGRRLDWPRNNSAIWRTKSLGDGPYEDGRWRYMLFDLNTRYGEMDAPKSNAFENCLERDPLFANALASDRFRRDFRAAVLDMADRVFAVEKVDAFIDEYQRNYGSAVVQNLERYFGENRTEADFVEGTEQVRSFFHERKHILLEELEHYVPE